eukprot:scaffold261089_cov35-Tisochrysis_lutea.AAC.2
MPVRMPSLHASFLEHWIASTPVGLALGLYPARKHRRVCRLCKHDFDVWPLSLERLARAVVGATSAIASDPVVEPLACEVGQNLGASVRLVVLPIGLIFELMAKEPAMLLAQFLGLLHHTGTLACLGRDDDLGAKEAHQLPPLDRKWFSHADDTLVPALRADHCDGNARVSRGGLDYGVALLKQPLGLGIFNDCDRKPVLDRGEREEKGRTDGRGWGQGEGDGCGVDRGDRR